MSVISLVETGSGSYAFTLRSSPAPAQDKDQFMYEGFITKDGQIEVTKKEPNRSGCPRCLAGDTRIATPKGYVPIKELRKGMSVWTATKAGERIVRVITATSKVPARNHEMVQLVLDDGRELLVSAGHPTVDGRTVQDLAPRDVYDGARVVSTDRVAYDGEATYDILPSGDTGFYWANSILLDSTLH